MKVFITGATGMLGSAISFRLIQEPEIKEIRLLYRNQEKLDFLLNHLENSKKIMPVKGDLKYQDFSLEDIDAVIHCGSVRAKPFSEEYLKATSDINILATLKLLETARFASVTKFIYISSQSVYKNNEETFTEDSLVEPNNIYSQSKLTGELLTKMYFNDRKWMILRLSRLIGKSIFSNKDGLFRIPEKILANEQIQLFGDLSKEYNMIDSCDAARAVSAILKSEEPHKWNCIYNICNDSSISMDEVFSYFGQWAKINKYDYKTKYVNSDNTSKGIYISNMKFKESFCWNPKIKIKESIFNMMDSYKRQG